MRVRRGVAVIGVGNWGSSLAAALHAAGLLLERVHTSGGALQGRLDARILWLCVPDAAIAETAVRLAATRPDLKGQIVVHSSGALDRHVLARAESAGAQTASIHPMMSFPTRRVRPLKGTGFAVETGEEDARRSIFTLIRRCGGKPFAIESKGKAVYHAAAMFGSPFIVATLAAGASAMQEAGIGAREALALLGPMAAATVANVQKRGLARSYSGPLARGDAPTVKLHRKALAGHPLEAHLYDSLAWFAAKRLPSRDRSAIESALSGVAGKNRSRQSTRER